MHRTLALATLALTALTITACNDGDTDDTDTPSACSTQATLFPEANEAAAYYRTTVEAEFTPAVPATVDLSVATADGTLVEGTVETVANRVVFTPTAPFDPNGAYATTLTFDCEGESRESTASWSVSAVGAQTTLDDLPGTAYALDIGSARFVEPPGVGPVLGSLLEVEILIGVESVDSGANRITFLGALGAEGQPGVQEACEQTIPFPEADIADNPYFEIETPEFSIDVSGQAVTINDLFLSGSFAPDGSYIDGAVLAGTVDTRAFVDLVEEGGDDDAVCELISDLGIEGVACEACADDSGDFCLSILADSIQAESVANAIRRIDDPCALEECSADPDCAN